MTETATISELEALVEALREQVAQHERRYRMLDNQLHLLERERQKLAALVHQADVGFVVFDKDGRVAWTNGHFAAGLGTDWHPAMFLRAACHETLCARSTPCDGCPVARSLARGKVEHLELERTVNGAARTVYLSAMPIKTTTSEIAEVMVMVQDLSDLRVRSREAAASTASAAKA